MTRSASSLILRLRTCSFERHEHRGERSTAPVDVLGIEILLQLSLHVSSTGIIHCAIFLGIQSRRRAMPLSAGAACLSLDSVRLKPLDTLQYFLFYVNLRMNLIFQIRGRKIRVCRKPEGKFSRSMAEKRYTLVFLAQNKAQFKCPAGAALHRKTHSKRRFLAR